MVGYWKAAGLSALIEAPEKPPWTYPNPFAARGARQNTHPFAPAPPESYVAPPALSALSAPEPEPEPARRRRVLRLRSLVILAVTLVLAAGAAVYPTIRARLDRPSVPAALRSFVAGDGVIYAPAGLDYSVRLPAVPVRRDGPSTAPDRKLSLPVHRSLVSGPGFEIVIRETILPSANVLANGLGGAMYDPLVGGSTSAVHVHRLMLGRMPEYDFDVGLTGGPPIRGRVFLAGHRFYLITVQSEAVDEVFAAVVGSFRLTA